MKAIDNEELRKLISEHPDLPLVFLAYNEEIFDEYSITVFEGCRSRVGTVWFDDERTYDDEDDVVEEYVERYSDAEEWADLNDDEFYKEMKRYVNENVRHYEAIIVRVGC